MQYDEAKQEVFDSLVFMHCPKCHRRLEQEKLAAPSPWPVLTGFCPVHATVWVNRLERTGIDAQDVMDYLETKRLAEQTV